MSVKVKICGITNWEDAKQALDLGADALGFNFYSKSPRKIEVAEAQSIVRRLSPSAWLVGVFVNEQRETVERVARTVALDTLQFHGDEDLSYLAGWNSWRVIKAVRIGSDRGLEAIKDYVEAADHLLIDRFDPESYGGTGKEVPENEIKQLGVLISNAILAGGLTVENVEERIRLYKPFGVDVASGVEEKSNPRKKDLQLMRAFIEAARRASRN